MCGRPPPRQNGCAMSARLEPNAGVAPGGLRAPVAVPAVARSPSRGVRRRLADLRLEQFVMGAAIVALGILVVFPLLSLFVSSIWGEEGPTLGNFTEALSSRLYLTPLYNSLILGSW